MTPSHSSNINGGSKITVASINIEPVKKLRQEIDLTEVSPKDLFKTICDILFATDKLKNKNKKKAENPNDISILNKKEPNNILIK